MKIIDFNVKMLFNVRACYRGLTGTLTKAVFKTTKLWVRAECDSRTAPSMRASLTMTNAMVWASTSIPMAAPTRATGRTEERHSTHFPVAPAARL